MKSVSIPLYKEILLDLQRRIRHGFYGVSGRLPSRRELCGIYGISEMTAYRVQTQLEREGFARREKGRGVFAVPSRELPAFDGTPAPEALRRIFILGMKSAFAPSLEHNLRMAAGAERRAAELGLETCRAFLDGPAASEIPNDADGLLLLYTPHIDWGHPLLRMRRLRKIMLNNVFPDMHCVLCGNHAGMAALLDHLAAKGVRSVCFCTPQMMEKFRGMSLLKDYLESPHDEPLTNLGVLRAYLVAWLRTRPVVNTDLHCMVRQLQPTEHGIPLELYFFSRIKDWVAYEGVQSDVFDYVLAIVPEFGLRIFQSPSGDDVQALIGSKSL